LNSNLLLELLLFCFSWASLDSSTVIVSFALAWEDWAASRTLLLTPHLFLRTKSLNFLIDFLAISACSTSSFHV